MPMRPATPISCHSKIPVIKLAKGADHIEFKNIVTVSNRLTSFDSKFTTFPGAVSPSAVCDSRKAFEKQSYCNCIYLLNEYQHQIDLLFYKLCCKQQLELSFHCGC